MPNRGKWKKGNVLTLLSSRALLCIWQIYEENSIANIFTFNRSVILAVVAKISIFFTIPDIKTMEIESIMEKHAGF